MATDEVADFSGPDYVEMLRALHSWKKPKIYLEICKGHNTTLQLSMCRTIAVGKPTLSAASIKKLKNIEFDLFEMDSVSFFKKINFLNLYQKPVDLAFIDGAHICETALTEFLHIEKIARHDSIIVLHDCLPLEVGITGRDATRAAPRNPKRRDWWLGDVWRTALYLKRHRPDLVMRAYGARPSGLICITGLDPTHRFTKADIDRAKAEMLDYDLSRIGIRRLFAEMEVQDPTLDAASFRTPLPRTHSPAANPRDRVVTLVKAASPHTLQTATFKDAKLQAFRGPVLRFQGGLVLGSDDDALRHRRGEKPVDHFDPDLHCTSRLNGEYLYGGPIYVHHFGHYMAEFVHRILPGFQTFGRHPLIFVVPKKANTAFDELPSWLQGIFEFLGFDHQGSLIVNEDTQVETLHTAQLGSHLGVEPSPSYLDLLADFSRARIQDYAGRWPAHRKIYVSRSGIDHGGTFLGERYLEGLLRDAGYHIMKPETLSFAHQAWLYTQAEEIIFCEGSACHGCELFGRRMLGRVFLLAKRELATFKRVLRPRSREFHANHGHHIVGTLGRNQDGAPLLHLGVHLLKPPLLIQSLHEAGFADLRSTFSQDAYLEAASADLQAYLRFYLDRDAKAARPALGPDDIAGITAAYERLAGGTP
jgi:hypothetical protein